MSQLQKVWLLALGFFVALSAVCCLWSPATAADMVIRYAPMSDAFARGEWQYAYHPRFGVLFMTLSGSAAWLTGLDGICSCQIVGIGLLAFCAVPVWSAVKALFDDRSAWIAAVMTLVATETFVYAIDGLRDCGRTLGLALCILAFVKGRSWPMALGLFLLVTLRTDLLVITGTLLLVWWVIAIRKREWSGLFLPTVSWLGGVSLMCLMTWSQTGCWLPGAQFVKMYLKATGGAL